MVHAIQEQTEQSMSVMNEEILSDSDRTKGASHLFNLAWGSIFFNKPTEEKRGWRM